MFGKLCVGPRPCGANIGVPLGFLSEIATDTGRRGGSMAGLSLESREDTNKARPASVWQSPLVLSTVELIKNSLRNIMNSTSIRLPTPTFVKAPATLINTRKDSL